MAGRCEFHIVGRGVRRRCLALSSPLFSPRGVTSCVRGASVRGAFGLTPTPLNQRRILDGRSKTVGKCKQGLPGLSPASPVRRRETRADKLGHGFLIKLFPLFSTVLSRKRQAARDRLAILKKGNSAMNLFPCGGERQAIQAPPPGKKPDILSYTLKFSHWKN